MNRMGDVLLRPDLSLPHTRGDEPNAEIVRFNKDGVCPTRVGMNRRPATGWQRLPPSAPDAWG